MALAEWVADQIAPEQEANGSGFVRVTVRIKSRTHDQLVELAKRLNLSTSKAATGILESAVEDAANLLSDPVSIAEALRERDERETYSALSAELDGIAQEQYKLQQEDYEKNGFPGENLPDGEGSAA